MCHHSLRSDVGEVGGGGIHLQESTLDRVQRRSQLTHGFCPGFLLGFLAIFPVDLMQLHAIGEEERGCSVGVTRGDAVVD